MEILIKNGKLDKTVIYIFYFNERKLLSLSYTNNCCYLEINLKYILCLYILYLLNMN